MFVEKVVANVISGIFQIKKKGNVLEVVILNNLKISIIIDLNFLLLGVDQKCLYDEHCIDGAYCMNQSICKCKISSSQPLDHGLVCAGIINNESNYLF